MQSANPDFQLYVVERAFSSGELNSPFKRGDVLEVNLGTRQVNWQGQIKTVKSVISAIRQGWIRVAREEEVQFIRKNGFAPSRKFEGPDLAKIAKERHSQMQESVPEDLRGEPHHVSEVSDSRTLDEIAAGDQYNSHEGQKSTDRGVKSAAERPAVPETKTQEGAVTDDLDADVQIANETAAAAALAATLPSGEKPPEFDQSEIFPKECRLDFDYKKRLSKEREKELRAMPLGDLQHLALFLKGRDKREDYPRKITERVWEILQERKAVEIKAAAKKLDNPEDPQLPFPFDVDADRKVQLHQLSMKLTVDQGDQVRQYYQNVDPDFAGKISVILAGRRRKGAKSSDVPVRNDGTPSRSSALSPNEASLIGAITGQQPNTQPNVATQRRADEIMEKSKASVGGAMANASDWDIFAADESTPMDIASLAGADSVDVSPVNSIEGETEALDVGNRPAPPEAQQFIGSEEGISQAIGLGSGEQNSSPNAAVTEDGTVQSMPIGGKIAQNAAKEGVTADGTVSDVSGLIGEMQ